MSTDPEHKFELALQLEDLITAHQLALEAEVRDPSVWLNAQISYLISYSSNNPKTMP